MFIECRNLRTIFLEKLKHVGLYETEKSDIYSVKQVQKIQNSFCCSGFFIFYGGIRKLNATRMSVAADGLMGPLNNFLPIGKKTQTNLDSWIPI